MVKMVEVMRFSCASAGLQTRLQLGETSLRIPDVLHARDRQLSPLFAHKAPSDLEDRLCLPLHENKSGCPVLLRMGALASKFLLCMTSVPLARRKRSLEKGAKVCCLILDY